MIRQRTGAQDKCACFLYLKFNNCFDRIKHINITKEGDKK